MNIYVFETNKGNILHYATDSFQSALSWFIANYPHQKIVSVYKQQEFSNNEREEQENEIL